MTLQHLNSRQEGATPALLVKEAIVIGLQYKKVAEQSRFYREMNIKKKIAECIRGCNHILGMSGSYKNGCLYREKGLSETWKRGSGEAVVCDHAIPVTELVRQHQEENIPIEQLIFSPVVRISKGADKKLTSEGFAKAGHKVGYPLYRYTSADIEIVTHKGEVVCPKVWTDEDHWELVFSTKELLPILEELKLKRGSFL